MSEEHPLDEAFINPSLLYNYRLRGRTRVLSVPETSNHDQADRALVAFYPIAQEAMKLATEHGIRFKEHPKKSRGGAILIDHITFLPD